MDPSTRPGRSAAWAHLAGLLALLGLLVSGIGCVEKKMLAKEARTVSVSVIKAEFKPPPRRIGDILEVLDQPGAFNPALTQRVQAQAQAPIPDTPDPDILAAAYWQRGLAASHIGRSRQAREDLRSALQYSSEGHRHYTALLFRLGKLEAQFGDLDRAIALTEESRALQPRIKHYEVLVRYYGRKGDFKTAKRRLDEGLALADKAGRKMKKRKKIPFRFQAQTNGITAQYYGIQGKYAEAEPYLRERLGNLLALADRNPKSGINARLDLSTNLRKQKRLLEAEIEARQAIREALGLGGREGDFTARAVVVLGKVILKQKRFAEAELLGRAGLRLLEASGLPPESFSIIKTRQFLITVLASRADFPGAVTEYDRARQFLEEERYQHRLLTLRADLLLALIKVGRLDEAAARVERSHAFFQARFGDQHRKTAICLGLRGMVAYYRGQRAAAYADLSRAMPIIQKRNFGKDKVVPRAIAEVYLDLLVEMHQTQLEKQTGIQAMHKAFKVADRLRGRSVQSAIAAASARLAGLDPELADLARKEQDLSQRSDALEEILFDVLVQSPGEKHRSAVETLQQQIETLSQARQAFVDEIETRFPKYFELRRPRPGGITATRKVLFADEAMIAIHPGERGTVVWAFTRNGPLETAVVDLGRKELDRRVAELRRALDPGPETLGDIPAFDLNQAYDLYRKLLEPVRQGWQSAATLIVVAQGPLGRLPFSVLATAAAGAGTGRPTLFEKYKQASWLIQSAAITRLPSVSVLAGLRSLPRARAARLTFAGFGDPFFGRMPAADSNTDGQGPAGQVADLKVRGIRVTETSDLDSQKANSVRLGDLSRLPETAAEIEGIAGSLGADPARDVFLGPQASEGRVKTMDLSGRRVIAFATHALVPGDLDGLEQPALALTSPLVTGEDEDGLLTMEEVFRLKLNADWIVLSACNTGAADGAGSEAASGLGRAFFFAGARAILVSMWPVETTSAAKLTTAIFRHQKANRALSRAGAVRAAMMELIESRGMVDEKSGKTVASYAHPLFWAPFITVGDGS